MSIFIYELLCLKQIYYILLLLLYVMYSIINKTCDSKPLSEFSGILVLRTTVCIVTLLLSKY